ncbi:MAG: YtxH domain-containing protein [Cyclobacteriaceae bacterium]
MKFARTLLTFIIGAAAGLSVGYLTAPRKGQKTRRRLVNDFEDRREELEEVTSDKLDEAKRILSKTVDQQAEKGKEYVQKLKNAIN